MNANREKTPASILRPEKPDNIDPTAAAGSKNSLGAESIRDGRPSTDDSVVEAIDEEGPGIDPLPTPEKPASRH